MIGKYRQKNPNGGRENADNIVLIKKEVKKNDGGEWIVKCTMSNEARNSAKEGLIISGAIQQQHVYTASLSI